MSNAPELDHLRAAMDGVTRQLTDILHERARLARQIGAVKRAAGLNVSDPEREQAMLVEMLRDPPADGFRKESLQTILETVLAESRAVVASPGG